MQGYTKGPLGLFIIFLIRFASAPTKLGRLSSRRWKSFPTEPDGTGLTCGQHIESHVFIFSFSNRLNLTVIMDRYEGPLTALTIALHGGL
jgi:hypothetical protein